MNDHDIYDDHQRATPSKPPGGVDTATKPGRAGASGAGATDAKTLSDMERDLAGSDFAKTAGAFYKQHAGQAQNAGVGGPEKLKQGWRQRSKGFITKHRTKLLGVGLGGLGIGGVLGLVIFFAGLTALPNYTENIAIRQLAKVTRAAQQSAQAVMREKAGIASLSDDDFEKAKGKYGLKTKAFNYINNWRVNKMWQNLETSGVIQYNYEKTPRLKRDRLVSITFSTDGGLTKQVVQLANPSFFDGKIHPVKTLQQNLNVNRQISDAVYQALKVKNPRALSAVRAVAVKNYMRDKLGVSFKGLAAAQFAGKNTEEARIAVQKEAYTQINNTKAAGAFTNSELNKAAAETEAETEKCVANPECLKKTVTNPGEIPAEVVDTIDKRINPERLGTFAKVTNAVVTTINPIADIAQPVCLIYDGSKLKPAAINGLGEEMRQTAVLTMAAADQQRQGWPTVNAEMVGAVNWKLGDTNQSNALQAARGEQVNTLASGTSTQATGLGGYSGNTIFNVAFDAISRDVANQLNAFAEATCPTLTSIWFGVGVGIVNIVATGITFGGSAAIEISLTQAIKLGVQEAMKHILKQSIDAFTTKKGFKSLVKYTYKEVQYSGAIETATYIAKLLVGAHSLSGNGLAVGTSFANDVDNGMNLIGNDMVRVNYGGRALTDTEALQSMAQDAAYIDQLNGEKSTFERYFAFDNPNSMATRIGMTLNSSVHSNMAGSMLSKMGSLFNPLKAMPMVMGSLNQRTVQAAESVALQNYGNVQFGWSDEEVELINKTSSYLSPSENEYLLQESGKRDEIAQKYGPCFDTTMGEMLDGKMIERDDVSGDVKPGLGVCSPLELGPKNPTYGDLVFRYRLWLKYERGSISTFVGLENPVEGNAPAASSGGGAVPTGTTQELAKKILAHPNIRFQVEPLQRNYMQNIADTGRGTTCGSPAINPKMLGVLLAAAEKYKIYVGVVVDGHACDQFNHPKGLAADINGINPLDNWDGGTGRQLHWNAKDMEIITRFYNDMGQLIKSAGGGGLGQDDCFTNGYKPIKVDGVRYFGRDGCNHLHLDVGA